MPRSCLERERRISSRHRWQSGNCGAGEAREGTANALDFVRQRSCTRRAFAHNRSASNADRATVGTVYVLQSGPERAAPERPRNQVLGAEVVSDALTLKLRLDRRVKPAYPLLDHGVPGQLAGLGVETL